MQNNKLIRILSGHSSESTISIISDDGKRYIIEGTSGSDINNTIQIHIKEVKPETPPVENMDKLIVMVYAVIKGLVLAAEDQPKEKDIIAHTISDYANVHPHCREISVSNALKILNSGFSVGQRADDIFFEVFPA